MDLEYRVCKHLFIVAVILLMTISANAQTTSFTYQGKLTESTIPANGNYDFEFKLFDAVSGGAQIGSTAPRLNVAVVNGIYTVSLDFGAGGLPGANRYLDVAVRLAGGGSFTQLNPRQQITSAPYAVKSLIAETATNATQLGGVAASEYVTNTSLGNSVIRNQSTLQSPANLNISGNGFFGGNVGIGTTAPTHTLDVNGFIRAFNPAGGNVVSETTGGVNSWAKLWAKTPAQLWSIGSSNGFNGNQLYFANENAGGGIRMAIMPNGNVGIGTTNPTAGLHVFYSPLSNENSVVRGNSQPAVLGVSDINNGIEGQSTAGFGVRASSSTGVALAAIAGSSGRAAYFFGNVGIETLSPQRLLHVNGRARIGFIPLEASVASVCFNAAGDLLQCGASSLKWKINIRPFSLGLDVITRLRPISYESKDDGRSDFGLGAEDVASVAPELAFTNDKGEAEGVKYEKINLVLINAVKEQQQQIDLLTKIVCELKPDSAICKEKNK